MKNLKNIIFDLGGVFIELDYFKTETAFIQLGVTNFHQLYNQHKATLVFEQLETGAISSHGFYNALRKTSGLNLSDNEINDAWNAMLGTFPEERLNWLQNVSSRYNIYLFSNTNVIHYNACRKIYTACTGRPNFDDYFIKAWYSHEIGARKPNVEAFKKVMALENLDPKETLFIDDTPANIDGAKEAGLQTILLQKPKTVLDLNL